MSQGKKLGERRSRMRPLRLPYDPSRLGVDTQKKQELFFFAVALYPCVAQRAAEWRIDPEIWDPGSPKRAKVIAVIDDARKDRQ